jgi:aspartate carbamoyltransferase regulatory subunit
MGNQNRGQAWTTQISELALITPFTTISWIRKLESRQIMHKVNNQLAQKCIEIVLPNKKNTIINKP